MMSVLREAYYTAFVVFFRAGSHDWTRPVNLGKGVAAVTLVQSFFVVSLLSWCDIVAGTRIVYPKYILGFVALYFGLYVGNRYLLGTCGSGVTFEHEWDRLPKQKRLFLVITSSVIMVLMMFSFVLSGLFHRTLANVGG